ncbi:MAG: restriction endonuclease subunit S [Candidatus Dadabacteria bacterium]|nr:restriction endonuclease subunit S [Candidatus Dadabacteria bacterium]
MNRYSGYKDSGVEWIGKIPNHWKMKKIKHIGTSKSGDGFPIKLQNDETGTIPFFKVSDTNLCGNEIYLNSSNNYVTETTIKEMRFKVFEENSIAFPKIGEVLRNNKRRILSQPSCIDNNMMALEVKTANLGKFLYYLMCRIDFSFYCSDGTVPSISENQVGDIKIPIPPEKEQALICKHLDKRTSQLDSLIEKISRKIELLKEKRTSLINQCVTRGLDSDVDMKDSGVDWIGKIPSHWYISLLKYASYLINKKRLPSQGEKKISPEYVESGTGKITNYYSDHGTEGLEFQLGDTLLNKLRVYLSKVVFCNFSGLSMGEMIVLRPIKYDPKYQFYLISSGSFIDYLNSFSEGVKLPRTPVEGIVRTAIPVPPQDEQVLISKYLDKKTSQINSLIEKETRRIELLKEYRQSLISNVVTGKVRITEEMI